MIEYVDILAPPRFEPSGEVKPVLEAVQDGNWLGAINLWIVRPGPALLYQERPSWGWAPGKLDGSAAGYYRAGEYGLDGLREVQEELGRDYDTTLVHYIGRRLNVGVDGKGRERRAVISIYMVYDDIPLTDFILDPEEVPAIFDVPLDTIDTLFGEHGGKAVVHGINSERQTVSKVVSSADFSYMWDGYHRKIAKLARLFAEGDKSLEY